MPSQLPAAGVLVGRQEPLAMLDAVRAAARSDGVPAVVVVSGPPGVGKTSLVLHWVHRERDAFPGGRLFADLRGHGADTQLTPGEVLARFIRSLGVPPERVPAAPAERAALFRSLASERHLAIVLDDARCVAQVDPLLPASAGCMVLVTSRWRMAGLVARGARHIPLPVLDRRAGVEMLTRSVGAERVAGESEAARRLAELCAGLPLALSVVGARLATRPRWPLREMVGALGRERDRLAELALGDGIAVRAALEFSYGALPPDAARAYRLLGVHPGTTFDGDGAAATLRLRPAEAQRLLTLLTDANMLDDTAGGGYRFHDLTRLHARETAEREEPERARRQAVRRTLDWYLHATLAASRAAASYRRLPAAPIAYPPAVPVSFPGPTEALRWLDAEFGNLRAAARAAVAEELHATAWWLVDAAWPLFLHYGHFAERLEFERLGLRAARDCGDATAEAKMLNRTGLTLRALGRFDEAAADFASSLDIWRRVGDRRRMAGSGRRLALLERDRGRPGAALEGLERALDDYRAAGDPRKVALILCDLGETLIGCERRAEAVPRLTQAGEMLTRADDPYNHARAVILMGRARVEEPDIAAGLLAKGLRAMEEIGSAAGRAAALRALGDLAERGGRRGEAISRYEESRRILRGMGAGTGGIDTALARLADPGAGGASRPGEE